VGVGTSNSYQGNTTLNGDGSPIRLDTENTPGGRSAVSVVTEVLPGYLRRSIMKCPVCSNQMEDYVDSTCRHYCGVCGYKEC